jgi:hypothetical protein
MDKHAYIEGFVKTCEARGVDPAAVVKYAARGDRILRLLMSKGLRWPLDMTRHTGGFRIGDLVSSEYRIQPRSVGKHMTTGARFLRSSNMVDDELLAGQHALAKLIKALRRHT